MSHLLSMARATAEPMDRRAVGTLDPAIAGTSGWRSASPRGQPSLVLGAGIVVLLGACGAAPPAQLRGADPDPIGGILAAFERSPIVGFGEHHRSSTCHAFLRELIRDPRFAATVNDIVVEFATPFHQDILDRFVVDGADVDEREMRTARASFDEDRDRGADRTVRCAADPRGRGCAALPRPDAGEVEVPAEVYRDSVYVAQLRERAAVLKAMLGFDAWDVEAEIARAQK